MAAEQGSGDPWSSDATRSRCPGRARGASPPPPTRPGSGGRPPPGAGRGRHSVCSDRRTGRPARAEVLDRRSTSVRLAPASSTRTSRRASRSGRRRVHHRRLRRAVHRTDRGRPRHRDRPVPPGAASAPSAVSASRSPRSGSARPMTTTETVVEPLRIGPLDRRPAGRARADGRASRTRRSARCAALRRRALRVAR